MNKKFFNVMNSGAVVTSEYNSVSATYIRKFSSGGWTEAQSAIVGDWLASDRTYVGAGPTDRIDRLFVLFDLSNISGSIKSAYVILKNAYSVNNCDYVAIQSCPKLTALTASDFANFSATLLGYDNTKGLAVDGNLANIVSFNAAGITKLNEKGIQRFVFRQGENDYNNVLPTNPNNSAFVGSFILPKLVLTF